MYVVVLPSVRVTGILGIAVIGGNSACLPDVWFVVCRSTETVVRS